MDKAFNIYVAAADVAYYNDPVTLNPNYTLLLITGSSSYDHSTGWVEIINNDDDNKFIIAHEMGHRFLYMVNSGIPSTNCSSFRTGSGALCDDALHGVTSLEYQRCSWNEGFAHFFAAAAWNNHGAGESTCIFRHWSRGTLNCTRSSASYTDKYMENTNGTGCPPQCVGMCNSDYDGFGVEWDWWRAFWDAATCPSSICSNDLDMGDFESWFDGMTTSSTDNYRWFNYLHDEATTIGGNLEDAWLYGACYNGIDHPIDTISPAPCP